MFIIRWKWTPSCFHTDGLCDGKCISCLRTAILCRVVQRIYRAFGISHCIYMYRCSECVFMVQCGKSNMIWKRFYGATRSVWCDCLLSRKVWVLKSYYCTQVRSHISINWTSPFKLARLGCFKDSYQSFNNNYILGHYQCSLYANFTYKFFIFWRHNSGLGWVDANLLVDFGKVLCSSANDLQQNSNASSREEYIPQILTVLLEIHRVYICPLWPFVFCLSFVNNS